MKIYKNKIQKIFNKLFSKKKIENKSLDSRYDIKRNFRWRIEIPGICSFVFISVNLPHITAQQENLSGYVRVSLLDPVHESSSKILLNYLKNKTIFDFNVKLLDHPGNVVETWYFTNAFFDNVNFGQLDYSSGDPVLINADIQYSTVELV